MASRYQYAGCCVNLDGRAINEMKETAREICLSDFTRAVDPQDWAHIKRTLGFNRLFRIEMEPYIVFAVSTYKGKRCAYVTHSAIEYVFTEVR